MAAKPIVARSPFGFEEADRREARLLAVHAWPALGPVPAGACAGLAEVLRTWQEKYPGVPAGQEILPGHPARVLVGRSARADLVVIGRHAAHARHAGLPGPGSVRNAVLSHAYGPVVIVPSS